MKWIVFLVFLVCFICAHSLVPSSANHFLGGYPLLRKTMQVSRRSTSYFCEMSSDDLKDALIEVSQQQALRWAGVPRPGQRLRSRRFCRRQAPRPH